MTITISPEVLAITLGTLIMMISAVLLTLTLACFPVEYLECEDYDGAAGRWDGPPDSPAPVPDPQSTSVR